MNSFKYFRSEKTETTRYSVSDKAVVSPEPKPAAPQSLYRVYACISIFQITNNINTSQTHLSITNFVSEMPSFKDKGILNLLKLKSHSLQYNPKVPSSTKKLKLTFCVIIYITQYNFYNIAKKYERRSSFFLLFLCSS